VGAKKAEAENAEDKGEEVVLVLGKTNVLQVLVEEAGVVAAASKTVQQGYCSFQFINFLNSSLF
jgi:hypothetical protein